MNATQVIENMLAADATNPVEVRAAQSQLRRAYHEHTLASPAPNAGVGVDAHKATLASLVAAVSLLRRGGRKAAPSDAMFNTMLADYEKSIEASRDALAQQPAADGGFTAADMMDARQEGRKEAQHPAAPSVSPAVEGGLTYAEQRKVVEHMTTELGAAIGILQKVQQRAEAIDCQPLATPEQPEVVITTDESGRCVAVTRQDAEGRIVNVLWEAEQPKGEDYTRFNTDFNAKRGGLRRRNRR